MKEIFQRDQTGADKDCLKSSIASVLELTYDEVPDFGAGEKTDWYLELQEWLKPKGLSALLIHMTEHPWLPLPNNPLAIFFTVTSNKILHAVVGRCVGADFCVIHDPLPRENARHDQVASVMLLIPNDPAKVVHEKKAILTSGILPGVNGMFLRG